MVAAPSVRSAAVSLAEARWIAPGQDILRVLTIEPAECLKLPDEPSARLSVEIGRAAFRDPLILGGLAARTGLSCASCHPAGQSNRSFHFPGLSNATGTADTTSAIMSERLDDGQFNPRPIPSLVAGQEAHTVSRDAPDMLELFIGHLIVDEFNGPQPTVRVRTGLADYVRALRSDSCPTDADQPVMIAARLDDALRALEAASMAAQDGDAATAKILLGSARSILGSIAERLPLPQNDAARAEVVKLAVAIGALQRGAPEAATFKDLSRDLIAMKPKAELWQKHSWFNPQKLSGALRDF